MSDEERQKLFLDLYTPYHQRLSAFCRSRIYNADEAKDVMSETVFRAYSGIEKLRKKEAFLFYLFGIAKRVMQEKNKYAQRFKGMESQPEPVYSQTEQSDIHILKEAMKKLPEKDFQALELFEICGFSIEEISVIQESGISAVKVRLMRAREKLRNLLLDKESKVKN